MNLIYAAAASVAMLMLYFVFTANVGRVRGKTGLAAPAVTGDPAFERAYRVQMNTLEHMVVALPALWIYAAFGAERWAVVAAGLWLVGRIVYAVAYLKEPRSRGPGMLMTLTGEAWLLGGAAWMVVRALIGA
jgi:uncharacterized membrane protein YecN with MAPEG domain